MSTIGRSDRRHPRTDRRGEARAPAALAVLVAIALYALLPDDLLIGPRFVVPALELLLLVAVIGVNPRRFTRQTRLSRAVSLGLALIIAVANQVALGLLLHALLTVTAEQGRQLLLAAPYPARWPTSWPCSGRALPHRHSLLSSACLLV